MTKNKKIDREYLIDQVKQMVTDCGTIENFDAAKWIDNWLNTPNFRLNGDIPANWLDTEERSEYISLMIACIQSGAYF